MINEKQRILIADLSSNKKVLFLIWLVLIVAPISFFIIIGENLASNLETHLKESVKINLSSEMQAFKEDLSFTRFLEETLNNNKNLFISDSASETAKLFKENTDLPLVGLILYNSDKNNCDVYFSSEHKKSIGYFPKSLALSVIKQKCDKGKIDIGRATAIVPGYKRAESYLRQILKIPGDIETNPGEVFSYISGITDMGRLLICYFNLPSKNNLYYNGALAIVRENEISLRQLLDFAAKKSVFSGIERSYKKLKSNQSLLLKPEEFESKFQFDNTKNEISLMGLPSDQVLLRLSSGGTYYPKNVLNTINNILMLKVSSGNESLTHPIRRVFEQSKIPILLFFLLFSLLIFRIGLFGYAGRFKISTVIFASIFAVSLIPFSIFAGSIIYYQEHSKTHKEIEFNRFAQSYSDSLEKELLAFVENREARISKIADEITNRDLVYLVKYFKDRIKQINATTVTLDSRKNRVFIVYNKNSSNEVIIYNNKNEAIDENLNPLVVQPVIKQGELDNRLNSIEQDALYLISSIFYNALVPIPMNKEMSPGDWKIQLLPSPETYDRLLDNPGNINIIDGGDLNRIYTIIPEFYSNPDEIFKSTLLKLTVLFFNTNDLIDEFIAKSPNILQKKEGDYTYSVCFVPLVKRDEIPPITDFRCHKEFMTKTASDLLSTTVKTLSTSIIEKNGTRYISNVLQKLNTVILIKFDKTSGDITLFSPIIIAAIYFILIISAVVLFLRQIFLNPIRQLENASYAVTKGNYNQQIENYSSDEFKDLSISFNNMSKGLLQKERMSNYLASDILEEISANKLANLRPGGECIDVSIIFCSIINTAMNTSSEEITEVLSDLIDCADQISTENYGQIDKLIGDTLMIVFRKGENTDNNQVLNCCKTALKISEKYNFSGSTLRVKIGISSGLAVSGKIGSRKGKLDFTVIGNPVNLASRLKDQAYKATETGILICPNTIRGLMGKGKLKFLERMTIKGRTREFSLYELLSLRTEI